MAQLKDYTVIDERVQAVHFLHRALHGHWSTYSTLHWSGRTHNGQSSQVTFNFQFTYSLFILFALMLVNTAPPSYPHRTVHTGGVTGHA